MIARRQHLISVLVVAAAVSSGPGRWSRGALAQSAGPGSVSGIVVSGETPAQPLRRATVSLVSSDLRVPLTTITGDDGRFTFTNVPGGHYSVIASKAAYVGAFYGSKRPGRGPGVPVAVPAGGRVTDVRLTLIRGGVITGSLKLPSGQPALNMPVVVVGIETINGVRRLRLTGGRTTTDDRGQYRVFGLPPGQYIVRAQPSGLLTGALTGSNDAPLTTSAEVSWAQETARRSVQTGGGATVDPPPQRGPTANYSAVYFPGTTDVSSAATVDVGPGEERGGIDFALALVTTAKISGSVTSPDGRPLPNVPVSIDGDEDGLNLAGLLTPRAPVRSGADGSFSIPAVAPGRYRVSARATDPTLGEIWALQDLVVDGREISNVGLLMQPGMAVSGRVSFDATQMSPPTADDLARARVVVTPTSSGGAAGAVLSAKQRVEAPVDAAGAFVVRGLPPGRYRVSATVPGMPTGATASGWSLVAIDLGGRDVSDRALDVRPSENVSDLLVRFSDRPTELRGRLLDASGRAAPGYPIVVFSSNRDDWFSGSRRVAVARPSTDGTFQVAGLPGGAYYLAAVVSIDPSDIDDPSFLEQLAASAVSIALKQGMTVTQDLRIR